MVRWNIAVSEETDKSVKMFLAAQGRNKKGDLSHFVEEAIRSHILELTASSAKRANAGVTEADLSAAVDQAVQWARQP